MSSLATIQDWLETSANSPVSIWCDDPETHKEKIAGGFGEKTFLSYRVSFKQAGRDVVSVRHRYSEFETLRTDLRDRYHGLGVLVPALPPKHQIQSMTNTFVSGSKMIDLPFVKERTFGLTLFCENIVAIPWLKHDATWRSFLLPSSQLNFGNLYSSGEDVKPDNIGEEQLVSLLTQLEVPYNYSMSQKMDELREEINLVEKHSKYLLEKVRAVQSCQRALFSAQEAMEQGFEAWKDVERLHLKSLGGKAFGEYENVLRGPEQTVSSFSALAQLLKDKAHCERHSGDYIGLTLLAILEQQLSFVEAFRELFALHDASVSAIDALTTKISRLESGTAIMSFMSSNTTEQVAESKRQLAEKQTQLHIFYKGLVYFTVPLLARMRAGTLRRLNAVYASCCMSESFNAYKACVEYFVRAGLSAASVAECAAKMCEVVSLQPVAALSPSVYAGEGLSLEVEAAPSSDVSVYDNPGFLSRDTEGMRGLFDRAVKISRSKGPLPALDTRPQSTHLFTSSVNTHAAPMSPGAVTAGTSATSPVATTSPFGQNPLSAKRISAVRGRSSMASGAFSPAVTSLSAAEREEDGDEEKTYESSNDNNNVENSNNNTEHDEYSLSYQYRGEEAFGSDVSTFLTPTQAQTQAQAQGEDRVASLLDSLLNVQPSPVKSSAPDAVNGVYAGAEEESV